MMINKMNCELMLTYDTPSYMFNVYKNQLSRQTGSRNLTGPKTFPVVELILYRNQLSVNPEGLVKHSHIFVEKEQRLVGSESG
jgi:hypothetical protein